MAKQGKRVSGFLFERGGMWYAEWSAYKVRNRRCTGIAVGKGKTEKAGSRKRAEKVLADLVAPYRAATEADVRAGLAARQRAAEEVAEAEKARAAAVLARIPLADAWKRHPYTESQCTRGRLRVFRLSERNVTENKGAWDKFKRWAMGRLGDDAAMQDVTPEMAAEYSRWLQDQGLTPQRHNKLITTAGVMYRIAGVPSPFAGIPKLREPPAEHREPFTREQVARLLGAAEGEWKGFLAVLYYTGLRRGDAVLLRQEQRDRVHGKIRAVTLKTETLVEPVELPALTAILDEVCRGRTGYLFPHLAAEYRQNPNGISDAFRRFMMRVLGEGFEGREARKGGKRRISRYGLHSFRHSFASHAAAAGVPLGVVQRCLGHASAEITRIYTHYGDARALMNLLKGVELPKG